MKVSFKISILWIAKLSGLFMLSRFVMRRRLLILCFHGFELEDESRFRPKLFMRPELFRSRLETLRKHRSKILPLSDAVERLHLGTIPDNSVVITIDDGFASTLRVAAPVLKQFEMPATLYQTTYYVDKPAIFRLVVQYMFWKTNAKTLDSSGEPWGSGGMVSIADESIREKTCWEIIDHGETRCEERERQEICQRLGEQLGVSYEQLVRARSLSLLTGEEIKAVPAFGIDVQLHTHRHRLPVDQTEIRREIQDNREFLNKLVHGPLIHFCYPSGVWDQSQFPWLVAEGVASATTCSAGFNAITTDSLSLHRYLDEDGISAIEFEGMLCGFLELARIATGRSRRSLSTSGSLPRSLQG